MPTFLAIKPTLFDVGVHLAGASTAEELEAAPALSILVFPAVVGVAAADGEECNWRTLGTIGAVETLAYDSRVVSERMLRVALGRETTILSMLGVIDLYSW